MANWLIDGKIKSIIDKVIREKSGATLTRSLDPFKGTGFLVATVGDTYTIPEYAQDIAEIALARLHNVEDCQLIGLWSHDGYIYIEPVECYEDLEQAMNIGKERKQIAIGYMINGKYMNDIPLAHS